jgi:hypothetical protein
LQVHRSSPLNVMLLLSLRQIGPQFRSIQRVIPLTLIGKADDKLACAPSPHRYFMTPSEQAAIALLLWIPGERPASSAKRTWIDAANEINSH